VINSAITAASAKAESESVGMVSVGVRRPFGL
jgi:hypothetical protein